MDDLHKCLIGRGDGDGDFSAGEDEQEICATMY